MKTLMLYLLQVIICSGILYSYYHFFLRNKRFHQYNRYYLLLATAISICIPFLNIPVYFDTKETKPLLLQSLTVFSSEGFEENVIAGNSPIQETWFTWKNILSCIYLLIAGFLFVRFIVALVRIARLVQVYPGEKLDNIHFITTNEPATPFSFFRWLFWNNKIELNSDNGQQIFRHELFHIRQKHSWDIIFFEIVTMIFWINPFFHLIKREIKAIHEFLADQFAVNENQEWDYAELLLMQVLGSPNTRLTNPFFHNQIKRRIAMLTTSERPGYQYLRKIMVLPLAAIIVGLFAFTYKTKVSNKAIWSEKPITIVVDAGHGGDDPGVRSIDKNYSEAEISLEIAKQIQSLAKEYNITVVMTREDNKLPGGLASKSEANRKRVEIANTIKPVAFISLHLDVTPGEKYQNSHSGFEAYVSKKRDAKADKMLASAILQNLATIYKTRAEARIRNQTGIYVLDQNNSPAVLLECGFINNMADLDFIKSKTNQEKIARSILESIVTFKNSEENLNEGRSIETTDTIKPRQSANDIITFEADTILFRYDKNARLEKSELVIINGKEYTPAVFKKQPIEVTIKTKSATITPPGNADAIKKYGAKAKNGVLEFKDAVIVKEVNLQDARLTDSSTQIIENKSDDIEKVRLDGIEIKEVQLQDIGHSDSKTESINPNNEVVVVGHPFQKSRDEKIVEGYPSKKTYNEKVVVGYPSKKTNNEKVVVGYPSKTTITEKVVVGYPIEKKKDTLNLKKLQ